ncbi:hypothetical protein [Microcoleus sp. bin38.metabat.b11b12b14.051]|uniref:hypothetical protein n=1 Tax=Microcoleus sp. bin38.metabat.b11b12b14.051 TaxID=2742709 RepID=UPI0025E0C937|nr:hypothetical protein [Microcoleus sp. bin38.metabat.b11b12b14.051]
MARKPESTETSVSSLFSKIESLLMQAWQETGHGCLTIESEKISAKKIKVIIRGSTHYRYVISDEGINEWVSKHSTEED